MSITEEKHISDEFTGKSKSYRTTCEQLRSAELKERLVEVIRKDIIECGKAWTHSRAGFLDFNSLALATALPALEAEMKRQFPQVNHIRYADDNGDLVVDTKPNTIFRRLFAKPKYC